MTSSWIKDMNDIQERDDADDLDDDDDDLDDRDMLDDNMNQPSSSLGPELNKANSTDQPQEKQ